MILYGLRQSALDTHAKNPVSQVLTESQSIPTASLLILALHS